MFVVFLIVIISCIFCTRIIGGKIFSPVFMLCSFWLVIGIFAEMALFDVYRPSDKVWTVTTIGVIAFSFGALLATRLVGNRRVVFGKNKLDKNYVFDSQKYNIIVCLMLLYCAYRLLTAIKLLRMGLPLDMIRMLYFGNSVYGYKVPGWASTVEIYLHLPALYAAMTIVAMDIALPKDKHILKGKIRILSIAWIIIATFVSGGRNQLYAFAIEVLVAFFVTRQYDVTSLINIIKKYSKLIFVILLMIFFLYLFSIMRNSSGKDYDFIRSIYVYFCGAFAHMDSRFNTVNFEDYTWGLSLLSGFLRPIMLVWKYLFGAFPELYQKTIDIGSTLQSRISIGNNVGFNAFVLPVYYFYYDAAFLGVAFDSLVCGFVSNRIYAGVNNKKFDSYKVGIFLLVVYAIAMSMVRYAGNLVYYALSFVVLRLLHKKVYDKNEQE